MPLREATPAASAGRVLGDEDRVSTKRCLPPVIGWLRGCKPQRDEVTGMGQDGLSASGPHIFPLALSQPEATPESRMGQMAEYVVEVSHVG
jgi:hypothetical protein